MVGGLIVVTVGWAVACVKLALWLEELGA
jgi:hypothetical protein